VGHAFTAEALMEGQAQTVERNLWMAVNSLEESANLYSRLAVAAHVHDSERANELDETVMRFQDRIHVIRSMLVPVTEVEAEVVG